MLFKILLSAALAASPILAVSQEVYEGGWSDGTSVVWQCQKGAQGAVKFLIVLPDGKQYVGKLSCGTSV